MILLRQEVFLPFIFQPPLRLLIFSPNLLNVRRLMFVLVYLVYKSRDVLYQGGVLFYYFPSHFLLIITSFTDALYASLFVIVYSYLLMHVQRESTSINMNLLTFKRFGENISSLSGGWNMNGRNTSCLNSIMQPVESQVQVLHMTMMFRILCNSDCRVVVNEKW